MGDIPAAWVTAGLEAAIAHHKRQRDTFWNCPSSAEAAAIIAGAVPLITADERRKIAAEIRDRASSLWPPGMHRDQLHAAADAVAKGGQGQERGDGEETS